MRAGVPTVLAIAAWIGAGSLSAQAGSCGDRAWSSIGVGAFHCPGGACAFETTWDGPAFRFTTEPRLRAIDPAGPADGRLVEGDVLVAVDRLLITSPGGGRLLAALPESGVRLTVRRGDRLVEVDVLPVASCAPPLIFVGNRVARGGPPEPDAMDRLDYTAPRQIGPSALDLSLGLALRCSGCELSLDGRPRWIVPSPPVVELVERGGVAQEAGLEPGDRILEIEGRDVTSRRGGELLHAMPRGDFDIMFERDGERRVGRMNRRVVVQHIIIDRDRTVRVRQGDGPGGVFAAIRRWFRGLLGAPAPAAGLSAHGESWGSSRLGALLRGDDGGLFEPGAEGGVRLETRPVVVDVRSGGPADRAGLRPGDILTHIDDHDIRSEEGAGLLFRAETGRPLALRYVRAGAPRRTTLTPEEER